jgi:hypothetical protein
LQSTKGALGAHVVDPRPSAVVAAIRVRPRPPSLQSGGYGFGFDPSVVLAAAPDCGYSVTRT